MNLIEQLRELDFREIGRWPFAFRAAGVAIVFAAVTALLVWQFVWGENFGNLPQLRLAEQEQAKLWETFDQKQRKAANLEAYRQQLVEIERSFGAMLRQLPGRTEVPSLLVDISQTGLASGLQERLFQPSGEVKKDFYAELPIKMQLSGGYHEFGLFVSGIAALPRIVTLHDIEIVRGSGGGRAARTGRGVPAPTDNLTLNVTAKTYRYLDDTEQAAPEAGGKAKPGTRRPRRTET